MGWPETHRYYAALREIENTLNRTEDGMLPWSTRYEVIFGDHHGLLLALWRRWELMVQAQVADGGVTLTGLAVAHPGLLRVLRAHAAELEPLRFTDPAGTPVTVHWGGAA
jgi:hypothetical protein